MFLEVILEPKLYDATLIGYKYFVWPYTHGLELGFGGVTSGISQLISSVVSGNNYSRAK